MLLEDISWQEFEAILNELGEHRSSRVAYRQGTLEIMVPLPEHERAKVIIGDLVKILLDELDLNWESFGSTTFKHEEMTAGVEPDDCFYIERTPSISKLILGETLRYTVLRLHNVSGKVGLPNDRHTRRGRGTLA